MERPEIRKESCRMLYVLTWNLDTDGDTTIKIKFTGQLQKVNCWIWAILNLSTPNSKNCSSPIMINYSSLWNNKKRVLGWTHSGFFRVAIPMISCRCYRLPNSSKSKWRKANVARRWISTRQQSIQEEDGCIINYNNCRIELGFIECRYLAKCLRTMTTDPLSKLFCI